MVSLSYQEGWLLIQYGQPCRFYQSPLTLIITKSCTSDSGFLWEWESRMSQLSEIRIRALNEDSTQPAYHLPLAYLKASAFGIPDGVPFRGLQCNG